MTVEEVFTGRLLVPDYQRGYAWRRRQLDDFIEDLEVVPPQKEQYTGTLILHPPEGEDPHEPQDNESWVMASHLFRVGGERCLRAIEARIKAGQAES